MVLSGVRQYVRDNRDVVVGLALSSAVNLTLVTGIAYFATLNYLSVFGARFPGEGVEFLEFIFYGQAAWVTLFHTGILILSIMLSLSEAVLKPGGRIVRPDFLFILCGALLIAALLQMGTEYYPLDGLQGRILILLGTAYSKTLTFLTSFLGQHQSVAYGFVNGLFAMAIPIGLSIMVFRPLKRHFGAYVFIPLLVSLQTFWWLNSDAFAAVLKWTKYGGGVQVETLLYTRQNACDVKLAGRLLLKTKTTVMLIKDDTDLIEIETKNICHLRYLDTGNYRRIFKPDIPTNG